MNERYRLNKEYRINDSLILAPGTKVAVKSKYFNGAAELFIDGINFTFSVTNDTLKEYFCEIQTYEQISKDDLYRTKSTISQKNITFAFIFAGFKCKIDHVDDVEVCVRFKSGNIEVACSFSHEEFKSYFEKVPDEEKCYLFC